MAMALWRQIHYRIRANLPGPPWSNGSAGRGAFRPGTEFVPGTPEMDVHFHEEDRELPPDPLPWNDDVNAGLFKLNVKAIHLSQESVRLCVIRENGVAEHPEIREIIASLVCSECREDVEEPREPSMSDNPGGSSCCPVSRTTIRRALRPDSPHEPRDHARGSAPC